MLDDGHGATAHAVLHAHLVSHLERDLLLARYQGGVSTAALAQRLGVTEKAVEGRLHRAREALRTRLKAVGEAWSDRESGEGSRA